MTRYESLAVKYNRVKRACSKWKSIAAAALAVALVGTCVMVTTVQALGVERQIRDSQESRIAELESRVDTAMSAVAYLNRDTETESEEVIQAVPVGKFMCTAYCVEKYEHICGTGDGITSSGQPVQAGVTVAADPDVFPYGTVLYIEGVGIRVVQDTGGAVIGNHLDVAVDTHEHALEWAGYGEHQVYVISTPEEVDQ